jgi:SagB-type dehydrogenase family enzyme
MTDAQQTFADSWPAAWTFHRGSSRWMYNAAVQGDESALQGPTLEYPEVEYTPLPLPALPEEPLDRVVRRRFSCRRFTNTPIDLADLSSLLFAGYGVIGRTRIGPLEFLERPVPSAGGLNPLELYVVARNITDLPPGAYHYNSTSHHLGLRRQALVPEPLLTYLFMGQSYASTAAFIIVITGVPHRSFSKYGDRGYRYLLLEAGHVGQNLTLVAMAQKLGVCSLGGFFDDELGNLLRLDAREQPLLYCLAVGIPEPGDRDHLRMFEADI